MSFSTLFRNAQIATMTPGKSYGLIENGAVVILADRIKWVGAEKELPDEFAGLQGKNLEGRLITPALIDCHTHLVYGGSRSTEFELRLNGASYEEIARNGGGILSTVTATRNASEDELLAQSLPRLDAFLAEGVATIEIKSGYGLDIETEIKMLRVARQLGKERSVRVKTSFLGAHAIPPEFSGKADAYIDFVCEEVLPAVHYENLADAVDGFCENIAFSPNQISRVFEKAKSFGLPVKLHAEQLSNLGGASLPQSTVRCPPIIWSSWTKQELRSWANPERLPSCSREHFTHSVKRSCHLLTHCVKPKSQSLLQPIATPVRLR